MPRKGQAGHRCSGTALTPPRLLTARPKDEGSHRGDMPSGAGGVQAKGLGLWTSACSDLGP